MRTFQRLFRPTFVTTAVVAITAFGIQSYNKAAAPKTDLDNLKRIARAMSDYRDKHGKLPPAALYSADGEIAHSWRVALLPELGYQDLYNEYRRNEPWDSDHNRQLLARMPAVYRSAVASADSTAPAFFVLTGPKTAFATSDGLSDPEITDAWDSLITAVSARREIPWTKPEDIEFDEAGPLPDFGGYHHGVFHAAFANGQARTIANSIDHEILRQLINACDGYPIGCGL